ncbi:MAG: hypothetical protein GX230_03360 [Lentisphaerae bacterium]|jgi:Fe2+ transport system protein FeoA|nr:hypothetical protein [Lentisphaerota bacterium]
MKTAPADIQPNAGVVALDLLTDNEDAIISACHSNKARDMGFAPGVTVRMLRRRSSELAVVVAVADARFMVSRAVAQQILVARGVTAIREDQANE